MDIMGRGLGYRHGESQEVGSESKSDEQDRVVQSAEWKKSMELGAIFSGKLLVGFAVTLASPSTTLLS